MEIEIDHLINELQKTKVTLDNTDVINKKLNDISIMCFIQNVESVVDKLFFVSVKICDDISELESLDINHNNFTRNTNISYYVVQLFVSQLFQTKLIDNHWIACINIKNPNENIYKIVNLKNLVPSDNISFVIPFPESDVDSIVETRFYLPNNLKFWANFSVSRIETDVSYVFTPLYEHKLLKTEVFNPLYEISKLYTDCVKLKDLNTCFEYRFNCKMHLRYVFELILKNNIHKLNINHVQLLNSNEDVCNIQLFVNNTNASIVFDAKNKILKVKGCVDILNRIKEFLIGNVKKETQILVDPTLVVRLQVSNIRKNG